MEILDEHVNVSNAGNKKDIIALARLHSCEDHARRYEDIHTVPSFAHTLLVASLV